MTLKQIFPFLLLIAFILGAIFKPVSQFFLKFVPLFLIFSLYLGFLNIDFSYFLKEVRNWKYHSYLVAIRLIIIPIIAFLVTSFFIFFFHFQEEWKIAAILLFGISTGVAAPSFVKLFHGNFERALVNTILTSLLVSISLPFLLYIFSGEKIEISFIKMSLHLAVIIGTALISAIFTKYLPYKIIHFLKEKSTDLNIISLTLVLFSVASSINIANIQIHPLLEASILLITLNTLHFFLGWKLSFSTNTSDKFTVGALQVWMNNALSIVIATQFFLEKHPLVVFFTILSEIPWIISPIFFRWFLKEKNSLIPNISI